MIENNWIEVSQLFTAGDVSTFAGMYQAGKVKLIDPIIYYRKTGAFYAHFYLTPGKGE